MIFYLVSFLSTDENNMLKNDLQAVKSALSAILKTDKVLLIINIIILEKIKLKTLLRQQFQKILKVF